MADFYATFSSLSSYQAHLVVNQASQSIEGNYSVDNWAEYVEKLAGSGYFTFGSGNTGGIGGDISGAANGWAPYDFRSYTQRLIGSGSGNVAHNADGTKTASGSFAAADTAGGNMGSASGSWVLGQTTIPRATTPTFSDPTCEVADTVTISLPRAASAFTHELSYAVGSLTGQTAGLAASSGVGTSTTFTPPLTLLRQMPAEAAKTLVLTVITKNGSTVIGTKTAILSLLPPGSVPYLTPTVAATVERTLSDGTPAADGTCLTVHVDATVGSIDTGTEQNDLTYAISARPRGTSTWYELETDDAGAITLTDDFTFVEWDTSEPFAVGASYEVKVDVEDVLGETRTRATLLGPGEAVADFYRPTRALAVGALYDPSLGGPLQLHGSAVHMEPFEIEWSAGSLASNAEAEIDIALPSACVVHRVVTNGAARVRLYDRAAKSTADASRASGVQPTGDHGVLLELDYGTAAEDVGFYPPAIVSNRDGTGIFKMRVKNLAGSTATRSGSLWVVL